MRRCILATGLITALFASLLAASLPGHARAAAPTAPIATVSQTHSAFLDKTRFLAHMGVAFYAFHHFVWARYRSGQLNMHHKFNLVKAGIALLFAYHEVKVAYGIAQKSNSKTLHALIAPINAVAARFQTMGNSLHSGQFNASSLTNLNGVVSSLGNSAGKSGYGIKDIPVSIPGA